MHRVHLSKAGTEQDCIHYNKDKIGKIENFKCMKNGKYWKSNIDNQNVPIFTVTKNQNG
jgi:hypothetical protein